MALLTATINTRDVPDKKLLKAALVASWELRGRVWQKRFLPKHFTMEAYSRYRYRRRSQKYVARKLREKGHNLPMVWSGLSRSLAGLGFLRVPKKGTGVTSPIPALTLNFRPQRGKVSMRKEVETVLRREDKVLDRLQQRKFERTVKLLQKKPK